jgi:hypothetical protein
MPQVFVMPTAAGTVSVGVSRSGEITINGDAFDNFVVVDIEAGKLQVSGWQTGTKFRTIGGSLPTDSISLPLPSQIRSLAVNLRGGNDSLRVRFQSDTQITRDFSVVLGDGQDFVDIASFGADVRIGHDATIELGNGSDRGVMTLQNGGSFMVTRDLNVRTGSGADSLLVIGDDQLTLLAAEAGRDITINAFLGSDATAVGNVRAGRGLLMNDIESQLLQNVTVVGTLTMRTGSGSSRTVADQLQLGRLDAVLGGSSDKFALGENVNVRLSSVVNGGGGSNLMYSGKLQPRISFRRLVPGLRPEDTLQILSGLLSSVPRPTWSIQAISEPVWPMRPVIIPMA